VSLIDAKLGGVPVIDVHPRGWDKADRRLIIYVHGGAFTFNSARTTVANAARLAAKSGIRVISVDCTLAPAANWKIIQDQVLSVFKDLLEQGYRMPKMAIIGDSAGGNLATRTVLTLRDNGLGMPAGAPSVAVSISTGPRSVTSGAAPTANSTISTSTSSTPTSAARAIRTPRPTRRAAASGSMAKSRSAATSALAATPTTPRRAAASRPPLPGKSPRSGWPISIR
jgi:acetyl esterase/lipase